MNSLKNILILFASCFWRLALIMVVMANSAIAVELGYPNEYEIYNSIEKIDFTNSDALFFSSDTIPSIWDQIDLTSPRMKQEAKVFPWWIPISVGAASAGGLILILNEEDEPSRLLVSDDIINQECGESFSFDPTLNDVGTGVRVVSITGESEYGLTLSGNIISFPASLNTDISITVNLEDDFGNTEQSSLFVIFSSSPIEIADKSHIVDLNTSVSGNLLNGSNCTSCLVESFEGDEQFGTFSITSSGDYNFIPNNNFIGRAIFNVTVSDNCSQTAIVKITIEVRGDNCDINPIIIVENTECGAERGSINIELSPAERYTIIWEDGDFEFNRNNLAEGEYNFRIIDLLGLCEENFEVNIEEVPLNLASNVEFSAATCLGGGEISIFLNTSEDLEYRIEFEGNQFLQFVSSSNPVHLHEVENLLPGEYSIFINKPGRAERCGETVNLLLEEEIFPLEAIDDFVVTTINTPWQGNVLINDIGTGINVIDFEAPLNGTANISADGEAIFTPNLNFTGVVVFEYTIQDTCGNTSNGSIRIEVLSDCLFTVAITTSPSQCGLNNGRAEVMISPEVGQYMVTWSTGQMSNQISNLPPGNYSVTVLDVTNDCSRIIMFTIIEADATIVDNIMVENATCIDEGRIFGTFNMQYSIPFRIEVFFENEFQGEFEFNTINFDLQPLLNLKPGTYKLIFKSVSLGNICLEEIIIEIGTDDLPMEIVNDSATININTFWNDNVLDNDSGTGLRIISFTQSPEGTVIVQQDGEALFTPNLNFVGETSFDYSVRDTCGAEKSGTVFIEVVQNCLFTGTINTSEATCGEQDGSAILVLSPPAGNYQILWSSGDVGLEANNLPSGPITVTVTDVTNNCEKVFVDIVEEIEPKIFDNVESSPAECTGGGNIFGTFVNTYPGPYRILVFRNGIFMGTFNFTGPNFSLDEFLEIFPGNYTLIVSSLTYNPSCSQRLLIEVEEIPTTIIVINDTFVTPENTSVSGNVLNNDIGQDLVLLDISAPSNGSITFAGNGSFTYTPNPDFFGVEILNYTVIDICQTVEIGDLRIVVLEGPSNQNSTLPLLNISSHQSAEKSSTFYFNTLNIQPIAFSKDLSSTANVALPIYSFGLNTFIHNNTTKNIFSASFAFHKPIQLSNQTNKYSNYQMNIGVGKTLALTKNVLLYSMIGPGMDLLNNSFKDRVVIPHINLSNGVLLNLSNYFTIGLNHNLQSSFQQVFNLTELKIYNKF